MIKISWLTFAALVLVWTAMARGLVGAFVAMVVTLLIVFPIAYYDINHRR